VRYKEYGPRNRPTNAREMFNLRHSSLRVTIERAFDALKNRFRILDNKLFHPFIGQVKLVLACCILYNWIIGFGLDEVAPNENCLPPMHQDTSPIDEMFSQDSQAMTAKRDNICNAMWDGRGVHRT
jgi:hypothetical protein